jgi:hypothetical protein
VKNLLDAINKMKSQEDNYVEVPEVPKEDIDWDTIEQFEGGRQTKGYVPQSGKSGVTVSSGFDVGQRENLDGLPPEIQQKLQPFVGAKRGAAERKLSSLGGVELSTDEANTVASFAKDETTQKLMDDWKRVSDVPFESLSPAQKTVLASVAHQYGGISRTPRFAQFAGKGQWDKVVKELNNFKDQYKTRRSKEAEYLAKSLERKK